MIDILSPEALVAYWNGPRVAVNIIVFLNLLGALLLGLMVGYERSYHGRAAGMRTYGLVCMASAALTSMAGYPHAWFGGQLEGINLVDPTRTIQGIVTGIGFLGAGIIMKDGLNISGLTTAASIWAASAIGILVGVGFYAAAIMLTLLSAGFMMWGSKLEAFLPSRHAVAVIMRFRKDFVPEEETIRQMALERGYRVAKGSVSILYQHNHVEWRFVAVSLGKGRSMALVDLSKELLSYEGVESFQLSHARN
jgi:putative Mg2+ transporter-C (MgtC) family protein